MKTWEEMTERERYEMLCRGEVSIPPQVGRNLKCRYVDRGIPFLKIAPFKEEEAYLDPRIVIYHNVIHDEEIETIKRMAQPRVNSPILERVVRNSNYHRPLKRTASFSCGFTCIIYSDITQPNYEDTRE